MITKIPVDIKQINPDALPLCKGSSVAAGIDVAVIEEERVVVRPGETHKFPTGYGFAVPPGVAMLILPRSGTSSKRKLRPANTPGLLDPDYRGELFIALENFGNDPVVVHPEEYVAQIMFVPYYTPEFTFVDDLGETERGDGGFGSTEERGFAEP